MLPPERIAELRAAAVKAQQYWICALNMEISDEELKKAIDDYQDKAKVETIIQLCDAMLAECERVSHLQASLSKACLMSGPDTEGTFVVAVSFENPDDATALFNFLKQAGAQP